MKRTWHKIKHLFRKRPKVGAVRKVEPEVKRAEHTFCGRQPKRKDDPTRPQ